MADVYVNALTQITSEPTTTDSVVCVNRNTNEGKIIDYNKLADVILAKLASKQFSSLTTASKLLPGAINELDADTASMASSISQLNSRIKVVKYSTNATRLTVSSGFVRINYPDGFSYQDTFIIVPRYLTGAINGWEYTIQTPTTDMVLYVRVGGTMPADDSTIALDLIAIKNIN